MTVADFPRFWDGDYWAYKVWKFTAINKFNNTIAKARRKGYSYKRGNQAASTLNLTPNLTIIFCADIYARENSVLDVTIVLQACENPSMLVPLPSIGA